MGIYTITYLYYNRLLSRQAPDRLQDTNFGCYIESVAEDRWSLHAPGRFQVVASISPVLEWHEEHSI